MDYGQCIQRLENLKCDLDKYVEVESQPEDVQALEFVLIELSSKSNDECKLDTDNIGVLISTAITQATIANGDRYLEGIAFGIFFTLQHLRYDSDKMNDLLAALKINGERKLNI